MFRSSIEKRLTAVSRELRLLREELGVLDEQLLQVSDEAEDARLRSLVSETPLAAADHREASKSVSAVRRDREAKLKRLAKLERKQADLLDTFSAKSGGGARESGLKQRAIRSDGE